MRCAVLGWTTLYLASTVAAGEPATEARVYDNRLTPLVNPQPLFADWPQYVEPIRETARFESAPLVDDADGDLEVRAWRFCYNARGIIEIPNRLSAARTALIVVHPWGIDDANGWVSPEPAGVALCCTPEKNKIYNRNVAEVVNPLLKSLRGQVQVLGYSLPNKEDPIRAKLYRSVRGTPAEAARSEGRRELKAKLHSFRYVGSPIDAQLHLDPARPVASYLQRFPNLDSSAKYNGEGFWQLPIPVASAIEVAPADVVFYDGEGYPLLRDFLQAQGIRHVLLCGYNTELCVCSTTAGYENLSKDFNLFLIGDATMASFPACETPRYATQTALGKAALTQLITQVSWIRPRQRVARGDGG